MMTGNERVRDMPSTVFLPLAPRIAGPNGPLLFTQWTFDASPQFITRILVDWGDGTTRELGGSTPVQVMPHIEHYYAADTVLAGVATFEYRYGPEGSLLFVDRIGLLLDPLADAATRVRGGPSVEVIVSGGFGDTLRGEGGNDSIMSYLGDDLASGGEGDDFVYGEQGADTLFGEDGNDTLWGGTGGNLLLGGGGRDALGGSEQDADTLAGGAGDDTLYGGGGDDRLVGQDGNDVLEPSDGNDRAAGGAGNDSFLGGGGDDRLRGGAGNDNFHGGDGNDTLQGGAGADEFLGGRGQDRLVSEADGERDVFHFYVLDWGPDTIIGFESGEDSLFVHFSDDVEVVSGRSPVASSQAAAMLFDTRTGWLVFDTNGNLAGGQTQIAVFRDSDSVSARDVVFVG